MSKDDEETAVIFNTSFASVFNNDEGNVPENAIFSGFPCTLNSFSISLDAIRRVIKSLPAYSSPGPDGITNILLKEGGIGLLLVVYDFFLLSSQLVPFLESGRRL